MLIKSPLEQFQLTFVFDSVNLYSVYFSEIVCFMLLYVFLYFILVNLIKNRVVIDIFDNLSRKIYWPLLEFNLHNISNLWYFPLIFSIFFFIWFLNIIGITSYTYTIMSQLIITFFFSSSLLMGTVFFCIRNFGWKFFQFFYIPASPAVISIIIISIEVISYMFRVFSLSIRLFANMMAGHTLLKLISYVIIYFLNWNFEAYLGINITLYLFILLMLLETGIACIQAYIFSLLVCIYLKDMFNLSH